MTDDTDKPGSSDTPAPADTAGGRTLSAAARRALAEAEERRVARKAGEQKPERELGGRGGADPARFGDWEINGRAIDF
jgi:hypothetical protein